MFINSPDKMVQPLVKEKKPKYFCKKNSGGAVKEGGLIVSNEGSVPKSVRCQQAAVGQGY